MVEPRSLKLRVRERRALKLSALQIGLAQIRAVENSTFEMPPAQAQSVFNAVELFWVVDPRSFERIKARKHEGVRKQAFAPPRHIINFAIEQDIVERGPTLLSVPSR